MLHFLVLLVTCWLPIIPLIISCGSGKREEKEIAMQAECRKLNEDVRHLENDRNDYKEMLHIQRDTVCWATNIERQRKILDLRLISLRGCSYKHYFKPCDFENDLKIEYYNLRRWAFNSAIKDARVDVVKWLKNDVEAAEFYIPFFDNAVYAIFKVKVKDHCPRGTQERVEEMYRAIDKIKKAIDDRKNTLTSLKEDKWELTVLKRREEWMKYEIFGEIKKPDDCQWKTRQETTQVLDTCKRLEFGGDCDFPERANWYARLLRNDVKYYEEPEYYSVYNEPPDPQPNPHWIRDELTAATKYFPKIRDLKEKHRKHYDSGEAFGKWWKQHFENVPKMKEFDKGKKVPNPKEALLEIPIIGEDDGSQLPNFPGRM